MDGNEDDEKALQRGFKAKVAMEAIRGDLTLAELAAKHGASHDDRRVEASGDGRHGQPV
jgi:hypothetical protein